MPPASNPGVRDSISRSMHHEPLPPPPAPPLGTAQRLGIGWMPSRPWLDPVAPGPGSAAGMHAGSGGAQRSPSRAQAGTWNGKIFCVMGRPSSASRVCSSSSSIAAWPAPLAACPPPRRAPWLACIRAAWAADEHVLSHHIYKRPACAARRPSACPSMYQDRTIKAAPQILLPVAQWYDARHVDFPEQYKERAQCRRGGYSAQGLAAAPGTC